MCAHLVKWLALALVPFCFFSGYAKANSLAQKPKLPFGATKVEENDRYIIYKNAKGELRILFDARFAYTKTITHEINNSIGTLARVFDLGTTPPGTEYWERTAQGADSEETSQVANRAVWVGEGNHRASGAARGHTIPEELGGTGVPHWLDYSCVGFEQPKRDLTPVKFFRFDESQICTGGIWQRLLNY